MLPGTEIRYIIILRQILEFTNCEVIQVFAAIFPNLGTTELLLLLVLVLLIFGPSKLPQIGSAIGKGIRELRRASKDIGDNVDLNDESKGDIKS